MVKVEIRYVKALKELKPVKITPSNLNTIIQCPLRALYYNSRNKEYRSISAPTALIGNVIHLVYEDLNCYLKGSCDFNFEDSWKRHEQEQNPDGLHGKVKNYSVYKATVKSTISKILKKKSSSIKRLRSDAYETLPEHSLKDPPNRIEGKPDLLVLKNSKPWEIKDYKTGAIYDHDAKSDIDQDLNDINSIKEDYKKQLYLYAWLAYKEYGSFPKKLTLITNDGVSHPVEFDEAQVINLIEEIKALFEVFDGHIENPRVLAQPSEKNCRYCNYRFGCSFSISAMPDPIGDLSGHIMDINVYPYGNCRLTLSDGSKVIFPKQIDNINDILCLKNKEVTLTFLKSYYNKERPKPDDFNDFYIPTKRTEIIAKEK